VKPLYQLMLAAALALLASTASPQDAKTRDQVKRELAEARRNGELIVNGEIGLQQNELYPHRFPRRTAERKTRDQVRAELSEARQRGDVLANGEVGLTLAELHPTRYGRGDPLDAGKSRNEVIAELNEARRNGDVLASGETGLTLRELRPDLYRGRDRSDHMRMGRSK
jgi:hypothetical protein